MGTCRITCDFPLLPRHQFQASFCDYPCSTGQYLYWDGSCLSACPYAIRIDASAHKFCDACNPAGYYLYPNGTCLQTCITFFKPRTLGGSNFCDYPCTSDTSYFNTDDLVCQTSCRYPYIIQDAVLCVFGISLLDAQQAKTIAQLQNNAGSATGAVAGTFSLLNFKGPESLCLIASMKMLYYIRYMKIKFPAKLHIILNKQTTDTFIAKLVPGVKRGIEHSFPTSQTSRELC